MPEVGRLLTVRDVAWLCQVHPMTVYRAVWTGELRAVRIRRMLRFRQEDVDAWLSAPERP